MDTNSRRTAPESSTGLDADLEDALDDIVNIDGQHYVLATSAITADHSRVLKQGETFAVVDRFGDIKPVGHGEEGLYHEDTRHLSALILRLGHNQPLLLGSISERDNDVLRVDLTNPDLFAAGRHIAPYGTVHLRRSSLIWQGAYHMRVVLKNFGKHAIDMPLDFHLRADFADIFEVRGAQRQRRGQRLPATVGADSLTFRYEGLDGRTRTTRVQCSPQPRQLHPGGASYQAVIAPDAQMTVELHIDCKGPQRETTKRFAQALQHAQSARTAYVASTCRVETSNQQFNEWLNRSRSDLTMMITETDDGPYPYAGVPWFSTAFGRDGLITALSCLWLDPSLARGVLAHLAATQAKATDADSEAEPGKILHETRKGEMALLGEVPFKRYYGTIDATPLFVMLSAAYYRRTHDIEFIRSLWPAITAALEWIDTASAAHPQGFLAYRGQARTGLNNQGWKDSADAVFHADGTLAQGPIALCEVQAYIYAAKRGAAELAAAQGEEAYASQLSRDASILQRRFEQAFWCERIGTYGLALDGAGRLCEISTSNPGHCLYAGITGTDHAQRIANTLLGARQFSGWGVRTLADDEPNYSPMSYHNGSVWPHDNALIAKGLADYGYKNGALRILTGLFDTSVFMSQYRMPELFCGFPREPGSEPTPYPAACAPQAWASASVFLLMQSILGLRIDAHKRRVIFDHPRLPECLQTVELYDVQVGEAQLDVRLEHRNLGAAISVLRRSGDVDVVTVK